MFCEKLFCNKMRPLESKRGKNPPFLFIFLLFHVCVSSSTSWASCRWVTHRCMWLVTTAMERWQTFCCKTMPKSTPEPRWTHRHAQFPRNIYLSCVPFLGLSVSACFLCSEWVHSSTPSSSAGPHPHHQPAASARSLRQRPHSGEHSIPNGTDTHF